MPEEATPITEVQIQDIIGICAEALSEAPISTKELREVLRHSDVLQDWLLRLIVQIKTVDTELMLKKDRCDRSELAPQRKRYEVLTVCKTALNGATGITEKQAKAAICSREKLAGAFLDLLIEIGKGDLYAREQVRSDCRIPPGFQTMPLVHQITRLGALLNLDANPALKLNEEKDPIGNKFAIVRWQSVPGLETYPEAVELLMRAISLQPDFHWGKIEVHDLESLAETPAKSRELSTSWCRLGRADQYYIHSFSAWSTRWKIRAPGGRNPPTGHKRIPGGNI